MGSISDDNYNFLGTSLPQYEKDEVVVRKAVGVHEQVVRDQQGRVRFHGAFTGGFSAGYFNTVDTKEGWTPQSFKSSRSDRGTHSVQKPEDFMDEEDTGEFGIAPKRLKTKQAFQSTSQDSSLQLARSRMGIRMLRRMGWRKGERLGEKRKKLLPKTYGCMLPPGGISGVTHSEEEDEEDDDADDELRKEDMCKVVFVSKSDLHGLGYRGMNIPEETMKKKKRIVRGEAFGIGALEEEDEDVYSNDNINNYHFHLGNDDDDHLHGWTAPKHHHDTKLKNTLRGFKKASQPLTPFTPHEPPDLPSNFKPFRTPDPSSTHTSSHHTPPTTLSSSSRHHRLEHHLNRHHRRGELLGEKLQITSVFDLVSEEDQKRLKHNKPRSSRWSREEAVEGVVKVVEKVKEEVKEERGREEEETEWEHGREVRRQLSSMMATRFVKETGTSGQAVEETKVKVGRVSSEEWHPAKLLCVRFNIEDPFPQSQVVGLLTSKQAKPSFFDFNTPLSVIIGSQQTSAAPEEVSSVEKKVVKKKDPLAVLSAVDLRPSALPPQQPLNLIPADIPPSSQAPPTTNKPPSVSPKLSSISKQTPTSHTTTVTTTTTMEEPADVGDGKAVRSGTESKPSLDVFKSIFESSDEEEEEKEKKEGKETSQHEKVSTNIATPTTSITTTTPTTSITTTPTTSITTTPATIPTTSSITIPTTTSVITASNPITSTLSTDKASPKKQAVIVVDEETSSGEDSSEGGEWVERKVKKSKHKKHKSKEKKHKKEKKKKKTKRRDHS